MRATDNRIASSGSHPTLEDLSAYSERRLSDAEADRIRSHILGCHDCAEVILDLSESSDLTPDSTSAAASEVELSWRRLRKAMDHHGLRYSARSVERQPSTSWKALALAASLTLVVSAVVNVWQWQTSISRIPSQVDPPWVSLAPVGALRLGDSEGVPTIKLPSGVRGWISFTLPAPETLTLLRVRFYRDPDASLVWSWNGAPPEDRRILRMEITTQEISPDSYRIKLDGRASTNQAWIPLAEYRLRVVE